MTTATTYPKIKSVRPNPDKTLLVQFDNGEQRIYDCKPLLEIDVFRPLQDDALFRRAHVDTHGYAIIWNDELDLAESEVWLNGRPVQSDRGDNSL